MNTLKLFSWEKALPYLFVVAGAIGMLASLVLAYEEIKLAQNPSYSPGCNISPILSCGSVMVTDQASVFGIPNSLLGLAGFSLLAMFGLALLAGAVVKRWLWLAAQAAATLGVIFMHYLFFQAVYVLGSICPWCFVVWMVTIPVFWSITVHNVRARNIRLPAHAAKFIDKHAIDVLGLWYAAISVILLTEFWYYWETFL